MKWQDSGRTGILVVDKPAGFTSFDVVAKLRGILQTKRIGHGGTLDPMATGVLPVFVGGAAKAVDLQPEAGKAYEAGVLLGTGTDTGDITGEVVATRDAGHITRQRLTAVLADFCGEVRQTPPMYSAVKVNGKPLYKYAREGKDVQRKQRTVHIHELRLTSWQEGGRFTLFADCSKGTYIRTLAEDIGAALGVPATLESLRRTRAGVFGLGDARTLEAIQAASDEGRLDSLLLGADRVFGGYEAVELDAARAKRLINGALFPLEGPEATLRAYLEGEFLGLARRDGTGQARVVKLFCKRD